MTQSETNATVESAVTAEVPAVTPVAVDASKSSAEPADTPEAAVAPNPNLEATVTPETDVENAHNETTVRAQLPEFENLTQSTVESDHAIESLYDVNVTIWAELGRLTMTLGELLKTGEGTVLKLTRSVSSPIDIVAQGVRIARGEVVVVDGCFAIRVKEIEQTRKLPSTND